MDLPTIDQWVMISLTLIIALSAAVQATNAWKQSRYARKQAEYAQEHAEYAKEQARLFAEVRGPKSRAPAATHQNHKRILWNR